MLDRMHWNELLVQDDGLWWSAGLLLSGFSCRQGLTAEANLPLPLLPTVSSTQRMCIFFFFLSVLKRISGGALLCGFVGWHCWE